MNAVLGIDFHQEVDVCGHDFEFKNLGIGFSTDALDNLLESSIHTVDQHRTAVLRTRDNAIFAGVNHVVVGLVTDGVL
jgi:hypothetical protein